MFPTPRSLAALLLALLAGAAAVVAVDLSTTRARLAAADPWGTPLFQAFGKLDPEIGSRIAGPGSELRLPGFPAGAPVTLAVRLSTAGRRPFHATLWVNGRAAGSGRVRGFPESFVARGVADGRGDLRLRFTGREAAAAVHFYDLEASWTGHGLTPLRASPACVVPLLGMGLLAAWGSASSRGGAAALVAASLALALALGWARLALLAQLPRLLVCLSAGLALALVCSAARLPRTWARWYVAAMALRLGLVTQTAFPCVDCAFHHHRYHDFRRARLITSAAPGPSQARFVVPYPPGPYAALQPAYWIAGDRPGDGVVRYAILALEGAVPLLVAAVARAGGASHAAAAAAAAALAVMPEGLLVSAKGIAANSFGGAVTVLALWALARRGAAAAVLAAVFALGLLSHVGAAVTLAAAVVLFLARSARDDPALARRGAAALLVAAGVAWAVYYREVWHVVSSAAGTLGQSAAATGSEGWGVRWYRVGKAAQDLLLKFGGGPLLLGWVAWRRGLPGDPLRRLATSWLAVAGLAGVAACVTPFPLRFEYFALPAVALMAGAGAEAWARDGRAGPPQAALALALVIQAAAGAALVAGRLEPINVILESPRWPLRDQVLAALPAP